MSTTITEDKVFADNYSILARHTVSKGVKYLREVGESELADAISESAASNKDVKNHLLVDELKVLSDVPAWGHTGAAYGFIGERDVQEDGNGQLLDIRDARNMNYEDKLRNSRVKVTLDHFRVANYPGGGESQILFEFEARNVLPNNQSSENLTFSQTFKVRESDTIAVIGFPVFVGLSVGNEGVSFKCRTVSVKNGRDEKMIALLNSQAVNYGLKLATTAQPAIAPLGTLARSVTQGVLEGKRNTPVHEFFMGLDFTNSVSRAKLAPGSYIVVQVPDKPDWDWSQYRYSRTAAKVVRKDSGDEQTIPYNYLIFSVSQYKE